MYGELLPVEHKREDNKIEALKNKGTSCGDKGDAYASGVPNVFPACVHARKTWRISFHKFFYHVPAEDPVNSRGNCRNRDSPHVPELRRFAFQRVQVRGIAFRLLIEFS